MRLIWHYFKRILSYDVPISFIGAFVTWIAFRSATDWTTVVFELGFRFLLIACTIGYAFSVLLYIWLRRRELPIFLVHGMHFYAAIASGFLLIVPIAGLLGVTVSTFVGLIRQ
jgi:hypothetical protein